MQRLRALLLFFSGKFLHEFPSPSYVRMRAHIHFILILLSSLISSQGLKIHQGRFCPQKNSAGTGGNDKILKVPKQKRPKGGGGEGEGKGGEGGGGEEGEGEEGTPVLKKARSSAQLAYNSFVCLFVFCVYACIIHTYMHTHIYTSIHTYTHTQIQRETE